MQELEQLCADFTKDVLLQGGEPIRAVVLYGSALGPEFRPGDSDYNFIIVAEPITVALLDRLAGRMKSWRRKRIAVPLLLTPKTAERSLDSYPLEFLSMKARYRVLHGDDFLAGVGFNREHVRLQCERELKSKLLLFRRAFLETEGAPKRLQQVIGQGLPSLMAIFRGMLYVKEVPWALHGDELLRACEEHLGFSADRLRRLQEIRVQRAAPARQIVHQELGELMDLLQRLVLEVDRW